MNARVRQLTLLAALLAVIVCAYGIGKVAANYFADDANRHYLTARAYDTERMVAQMNTVRKGDLIPDHAFCSLEGDTLVLSELVRHRTLIMFFDPGCGSCINQIEMMERVATTTVQQSHILIVSRAERWQLLQVQSDMNIKCRMLWDSAGAFHTELNVHSSPFSIIVDANRVIESMVLGGFVEEEMKQIADSD